MKASAEEIAGTMLFIGAAQFLLCLIAAEALYSGYSISSNMISDLGVGQTALLFNFSCIAFGALAIACAALLFKKTGKKLFPALFATAGIGIIGVGTFPETTGMPHIISAFLAFFFGAISAIVSCWPKKSPLKFLSTIAGFFSLVALGLLISKSYFWLGAGGMERMVVYPILIWAIGFGGCLMALEEKK